MNSESALIEQSLAGDTKAFSGLVKEYQGLVCAVTFSFCGDVALSQELAQEAFINAWKDLSKLKEHSRFKPWLCGIARNVARNAYRIEKRDRYARGKVGAARAIASAEKEPDEHAMAEEERALVWNALSELPENYREPLVLFYREEQSVLQVADALELSEDAVKQRLSRGRAMLKERVASIVEGVLIRTRPGPAFTIAVLGALPALTPPTASAAAAITATAAKGSTTGSVIATGWFGMILGPIVGVLGGWVGVQMALKGAKSEEERREVVRATKRMVLLVSIFILSVLAILYIGRRWDPKVYILALVFLTLSYSGILVAFIVRGNRRLNRLRDEAASPQCMVSDSGPKEYRSQWTFLGLPFIHYAAGGIVNGKYVRKTAKGWIALGDIAIGPMIAIGPFAFGGIAMGAFPLGLISIGGLAAGAVAVGGLVLGGLAIGGCAVGWWAIGGLAMGWDAAFGGVAIARDFALGGTAAAAEANTDLARAWFEAHAIISKVHVVIKDRPWAFLVPLLPILLLPRILKRRLQPAIAVEAVQAITSGWILECPKCRYAKPLESAGGFRVAASSYQKHILGYCPQCRRLRMIAIRKV